MVLSIDIGNTNIKLGVFSEEKLIASFRLSAVSIKTSDEYGINVKTMLHQSGIEFSDITGAIISSVNPSLNYTIEHMIRYYINVKPILVNSSLKTGIKVLYGNHNELGADRMMGVLGAYKSYGPPFIAIDFGTATTFNAVNADGEFMGGAITVGLKTACDALTTSAAKLPGFELDLPEKSIGNNTVSCMQSGIINGFVGLTQHMVKLFKEELGECKVIATGGLSEIIASSSSVIDIVDRTLILKGLYAAYMLNK